MQLLSTTSAGGQFGSILEDEQALSFEQGSKFFNPVQIDDGGTMDAEEHFRRKLLLELANAPAQKVALLSEVKAQVISGCLDPVDVCYLDEEERPAGFNRDAGKMFDGLGHFLHQTQQTLAKLARFPACKIRFNSLKGFKEP